MDDAAKGRMFRAWTFANVSMNTAVSENRPQRWVLLILKKEDIEFLRHDKNKHCKFNFPGSVYNQRNKTLITYRFQLPLRHKGNVSKIQQNLFASNFCYSFWRSLTCKLTGCFGFIKKHASADWHSSLFLNLKDKQTQNNQTIVTSMFLKWKCKTTRNQHENKTKTPNLTFRLRLQNK